MIPRCRCGETKLVFRLHGDRGGPIVCQRCAEEIDAIYGPRQKRILDLLGDLAPGGPAKTRPGELTQELLDAAIRLTHPDRHGPEHLALATFVTAELNALRPYVRPAPKPEPPPAVTDKSPSPPPLRFAFTYPCRACVEYAPMYYCDACRAEWDKRRQQERDAANAKARERRARERALWPAALCEVCGAEFKRRSDARYCSNRCRQMAHRRRVTDKQVRPVDTFLAVTTDGALPRVTDKNGVSGEPLYSRTKRLWNRSRTAHPYLNPTFGNEPPENRCFSAKSLISLKSSIGDQGQKVE